MGNQKLTGSRPRPSLVILVPATRRPSWTWEMAEMVCTPARLGLQVLKGVITTEPFWSSTTQIVFETVTRKDLRCLYSQLLRGRRDFLANLT